MNDVYYTLGNRVSYEVKVRGSRFIGYGSPVENREGAESYVKEISKRHHDATHHCFAYRVGVGDASSFRTSDGGEPSGTAGRPILEAIDGRELTNTVCVVTRYFGGSKLGTGGLARAYGQCAAKTLDRGRKVRKYLSVRCRVLFKYDLTGAVMALVSKYGYRIEETLFGSEAEIILRVRQAKIDDFEQDIINSTAGKVRIIREG
jgi:uncharacterized YigZ family protein